MDRFAFTSMASINERRVLREQLNNELANVSTVGFKKSYENAMIAVKAEGDGWDSRIQPFINLDQGHLMVTGQKLDIALVDKAVLGVQAKNGELAFTRRGDLRLNAQGVLETGSNNVVLSDQGNPITIPPGLDLSITKDGDIFARDPQQPPETPSVLIARMMTRDASQITLQRREDTLYTPHIQFRTPNGDFASGPVQPQIVPGALEASNVNPVTAMVKLIDFSRSFETQIRTIKEAKSLDEAGASMLRAR